MQRREIIPAYNPLQAPYIEVNTTVRVPGATSYFVLLSSVGTPLQASNVNPTFNKDNSFLYFTLKKGKMSIFFLLKLV